MRIKHWTQIAGGGRNGFIDNRPYIETVSALEKYVTLDDSERSVISEAADRFPMRITPYYLSLIDPNDPNDPIRRMCIPSAAELDASGSYDTSGENDNTVRDGIQHKYKQTALVLSTNVCAAYAGIASASGWLARLRQNSTSRSVKPSNMSAHTRK